MPFFKAAGKSIYYAHVPKAGGSSVADYIQTRFGKLGLYDNYHFSQPQGERWSHTSPQHMDAATLERIIPLEFFDAAFAIVRHPVGRAVSTYHFQLEVEKSIPAGQGFSDWLAELRPETLFAYDNHVRPMSAIVPQGATVFHLEHGLDALIPWFDLQVGSEDGPRAIGEVNKRGAYVSGGAKAQPTGADLARIAQLYAEDFTRFGYDLNDKMPNRVAPVMTPAFIAKRDADFARQAGTVAKARRKLTRKIRRWVDK